MSKKSKPGDGQYGQGVKGMDDDWGGGSSGGGGSGATWFTTMRNSDSFFGRLIRLLGL